MNHWLVAVSGPRLVLAMETVPRVLEMPGSLTMVPFDSTAKILALSKKKPPP